MRNLFVAIAILWASLAPLESVAQTIIRINASNGGACTPTPSGVISSKYCEDGDDGSAAIPLLWENIPDFLGKVDGTPFSVSMRQFLTEPGSPPATLSIIGSVSNWALVGDNLEYDGSGVSSGMLQMRAVRSGFTADSPNLFTVESIAAPVGSTCWSGGWICPPTWGTATCTYTALGPNPADGITIYAQNGICPVYQVQVSETNLHLEVTVDTTPGEITYTNTFAAFGTLFNASAATPSAYDMYPSWWAFGSPRARLNADLNGTPVNYSGLTSQTLPQPLGFEYNGTPNQSSGWENNGTAWSQIGGSTANITRTFGTGAQVGFWVGSGGVGFNAEATIYGVKNQTLSFSGVIVPPDPPVSFTNIPGGPAFVSGPGSLNTAGQYDQWRAYSGFDADGAMVYIAHTAVTSWTALGNMGQSGTYNFAVVAASQKLPTTAPIVISTPFIPYGATSNRQCANTGTWDAIAAGTPVIDEAWHKYAASLRALAATYGRDPKLYVIRLAWELDGAWYPWSICGVPVSTIKAAWNRVVDIIREEIPGAIIDISVARRYAGYSTTPGVDAYNYPGGVGVPLADWIPDRDHWDVASFSLHDSYPSVTNEATWQIHAGINGEFPNTFGWATVAAVASANGRKIGAPEWSANFNATCGHPTSPSPAFFMRKVYALFYQYRDLLAYEFYFSPSCSRIYGADRATWPASTEYIYWWQPPRVPT